MMRFRSAQARGFPFDPEAYSESEGVADGICFISHLCLYKCSRRGNHNLPGRFMKLATLMKYFYGVLCFYCFASGFPILVNADKSKNALEACNALSGGK